MSRIPQPYPWIVNNRSWKQSIKILSVKDFVRIINIMNKIATTFLADNCKLNLAIAKLFGYFMHRIACYFIFKFSK